ncbi:MAG: MFS transporter [Spirochaetales bacterium]|nr:MFS transporter [Spirochaetales bacterium]
MNKSKENFLRGVDYFDLSIIGAAHGLSDGFSNLLIPVLALIVTDLSLSASRAGLLLSIANVSAFVFIFPVSLLADHWGRRKLILLAGMSIASIGFLLMRWASGFWIVALLAFAASSGNAVYHPCGTAVAAERFPKNRALAISFHGLMGNIGASLMPVLQAAVATVSGWRPAIFVCAIPALVLLPLVAVRFPKGSRPPAAPAGTGGVVGGGANGGVVPAGAGITPRATARNLLSISAAVLKNKIVVRLAIVYALKGMGAKALTGFVPLYASQKLGMTTAFIGLGLTLYFGAGIGAKALMGYLYNRWGTRMALAVPLFASAVFAAGIGISPVPIVLLVLLAISGVTGPVSPIILTAASDFADRKILASSVGFIYTCHGLGFLSPLMGGWLAERFDLSMPFFLSAFLIVTAAVLSLKLPGKTATTTVTEESFK